MKTYAPPRAATLLLIAVVSVACLLAAFFGAATAVLPWYFIVVAIVLLALMPLSLRFPELGIAAIFVFVFEVVPAGFVPKLPIAGGTLKIYDILFVITAASLTLRTWLRRQSVLQPLQGVLVPLLYVFACVLISYVYGKLIQHNTLATAEARNAIGWLMLPLLLVAVDTPKKLRMLIASMLVIGIIVSIYGAIQSFFDVRILSHRVEELSGAQLEEGGVTRSLLGAGGFLGIFAIYYFMMALIGRKLSWWIALPLAVIAMIGLAVSFTRALWAGALVGALVAFYLYRGPVAALLAALASAITIAAALFVVNLAKPQMVDALIDRVAGFSQEVKTGGSFNWRHLENEDAVKAITNSPFTGVGMGGEYKKVQSAAGSFAGEYVFIHNGYMWYPLKMGVHASLIPFIFSLIFFIGLRRSLANTTPAQRIVPAATAGVFVTLLLASYVEPHWVRAETLVLIGMLLAIVIVIPRLRAKESTDPAELKIASAQRRPALVPGIPWRPRQVRA